MFPNVLFEPPPTFKEPFPERNPGWPGPMTIRTQQPHFGLIELAAHEPRKRPPPVGFLESFMTWPTWISFGKPALKSEAVKRTLETETGGRCRGCEHRSVNAAHASVIQEIKERRALWIFRRSRGSSFGWSRGLAAGFGGPTAKWCSRRCDYHLLIGNHLFPVEALCESPGRS